MISNPRNPVNRALFILTAGAFVYMGVVLADVDDLLTRKKLIAYCTLFATAVYATALPNALIPDPLLPLRQLLNSSPKQLLNAQLKRWLPIVALLCIPTLVIAIYDPVNGAVDLATKGIHLLNGLIIIVMMGLYSLTHYIKIGPVSQDWTEGTIGKGWDSVLEFLGPVRPPIPRALLPALTATAQVFTPGVLATVAALKVEQLFGTGYMLLPTLAFCFWALVKIRRVTRAFDRYYYHTNAFYGEVFSGGTVQVTERDPIAYDAVYWVPKRWKAHAWAGLLQIDRVFPIGRFLTIALILYVIVFIQNPPGSLVNTIVLGVIICVKNMTIYLLTTPKMAPDLIERTFQSKAGWSMTRFFINLRWTLPLGAFLIFVAWFSSSFAYQTAAGWIVLDIILALVFAWSITFATFKFNRTQLSA